MCGEQHLSYDDEHQQALAAHRKRQVALSVLGGGNIMEAALNYRHEAKMQTEKSAIKRPLRTPDEVLNTPSDRQYIFSDHIPKVIYCERKPYYEQSWMAGRYHPNPYHPPAYKVRIKNKRFGHSWRRVLEKDPPKHLRHLRQYQTRPLSYIEGFEP
jgi:type IV secretion system protein VirD4